MRARSSSAQVDDLKTFETVRIDDIEADPVARTVGRPLDSILSD